MIDLRSQNEKAIDTFHLTLGSKIEALIHLGFGSWKGEIESLGYVIAVNIIVKERPDD